MEIIYPPLVEDSVNFYRKGRLKKTGVKADMYRLMVEKKIISENGEPTTEALEKGWVKDYYEDEYLSLDEFLNIYPVFNRYDLDDFELIEGFWEVPLEFKDILLIEMKKGKFTYDERQQITEYLADR